MHTSVFMAIARPSGTRLGDHDDDDDDDDHNHDVTVAIFIFHKKKTVIHALIAILGTNPAFRALPLYDSTVAFVQYSTQKITIIALLFIAVNV